MSGAWLPVWILGAPFIGVLVLSSIQRGSSASNAVERPISRPDKGLLPSLRRKPQGSAARVARAGRGRAVCP